MNPHNRETPMLAAVGIANHSVRGFALGTATHGIGTARAFQESDEAGADMIDTPQP